jgi:hypothetical protein
VLPIKFFQRLLGISVKVIQVYPSHRALEHIQPLSADGRVAGTLSKQFLISNDIYTEFFCHAVLLIRVDLLHFTIAPE